MRILYLAAAIAVLGSSACSKSDARQAQAADNSMPSPAEQSGDQSGKLAKIDPCSLLTDDEVSRQVDLTEEPSQRAAKHAKGIKYQITKQVDRSGMGPVCHVAWSGVLSDGVESYKGTFDVTVMTASQLKSFEGMSRPKKGKRAEAIPGVGDEAFYLEYAPSARVGDLGVSIAEFPDTFEGNGGIELLKAAVRRLRG